MLAETIFACCGLGLLWSIINARSVLSVDPRTSNRLHDVDFEKIEAMIEIGRKIERGAGAFLSQEYTIMAVFIIFFGFIVFLLVDWVGLGRVSFYATTAYVVGSVTSMLCGYIGMKIAVKANFRTTYAAIHSLSGAFTVAFKAGCVMGFSMISISLAILLVLFELYKRYFKPTTDVLDHKQNYAVLMELLAAYGLGGSSIALFGRVGGGIYTKAADVGADLVGKVEEGLDEDSPRNPATIADNVGDNVGDIAGMGADLFGSFAESTCAALVFIASCRPLLEADNGKALYFPMLVSGLSLLACIGSSAFGVYGYSVDNISRIEPALKLQLSISTAITLVLLPLSVFTTLPSTWIVSDYILPADHFKSGCWSAAFSVTAGLISGLAIGYSTDYYTSHANQPVKDMAYSCSSGPAINIIY